ncbi:hypothetical protein B0O80DRAFT_490482 [Mortierella sp. GBAus27b]|nr:hypothetical protein BGX31_004681 [Mortierella sp. GBA43]KAI8347516.1 hypothetical protein B0O80DRAFT_490482 [Mortierella sp. GBAus27b]
MPAVTGHVWLDVLIGVMVSLIASVMNAAGLNLLKLDHVRNSERIHARQRHECGRPMWHVGLYLYVGSQVVGGVIALNFLKAQWVAPLGSIALIFNFVFAKILVGTRITRTDVYGTVIVMVSVIWIVTFGGMKSGADVEDSLTIAEIKPLFSRIVFIIYFSVLNLVVLGLLSLGLYAYWAISLDDESGQLRKRMKTKMTKLLGTNWFSRLFSGLTLEGDEGLEDEARDLRLRKVVAIIMATSGGLIASQTLLLAKSEIKLVTSTFSGRNQFQDMLSFFILFGLVFTAILQVYCLNVALKLYDSVLVVPMFYGYYTAFGLINSTIYLNQINSYQPWVLVIILIGIGMLIAGVRMLSAPKGEAGSGRNALGSTAGDRGIDGDSEEGDAQLLDGELSAHPNDKEEKMGSSEGFPKDGDASMIKRSSQMEADENRSYNKVSDMTVMDMEGRVQDITSAAGSGAMSMNMAHMLLNHERDSRRHLPARRVSLPPAPSESMVIHEGCSSSGRDLNRKGEESRRSLPRIDTGNLSRGRSQTRKDPTSTRLFSTGSRPMSPSEFRATYTDSPFPIKPKCLQDGAPGLGGSMPSTPALVEGAASNEHSPRWTTGSAKFDEMFEGLNPLKALRRRSVDCHARQDSFTGLPSEWTKSLRGSKHLMLSSKHERSNSASSGVSCRSASPAPGCRAYSPAYSRQSLAPEENSEACVTSDMTTTTTATKTGDNLHSPVNDGEDSLQEPCSQPNRHFTGTPPPMSALPGGNTSSFDLSTLTRQRRSSYTGRNEQGCAAAYVGLSGGGGASSPLSSSTGTFGGSSCRSPSLVLQLKQFQQNYHPPSRLKTSTTKASISTTDSVTPSMSTSTSFAQLADGSQDLSEDRDMATTTANSEYQRFVPESILSTSVPQIDMTLSQLIHTTELNIETLERELRESLSGTKAQSRMAS